MYARKAREENKRKKGEVEEKLVNSLTEDTGTVKQPVAREGTARTWLQRCKYPARAHTSAVISLVASTARFARRNHVPAYLWLLKPCVRFNKATISPARRRGCNREKV